MFWSNDRTLKPKHTDAGFAGRGPTGNGDTDEGSDSEEEPFTKQYSQSMFLMPNEAADLFSDPADFKRDINVSKRLPKPSGLPVAASPSQVMESDHAL